MKHILKIKHWQIFLCYLSLTYIASSQAYNSSQFLGSLFGASSIVFLIPWNLLLGFALNSIRPKGLKFNKLPYVIVSILLITSIVLTPLITTNGVFDSFLINVILSILAIFSLLYISSFPAKLLKSLELSRNAKPAEYGNYSFEFLIIIIGVWMYQPRINRIEKSTGNQLMPG